MANAKTKMFRSQMGGFNRDDVNNYIKETDLKHSEEINALKEKIACLTENVNTLSERYAALEETSNAVITEKDEALAVILEKENEIAETEKKLDFYKGEAEAQINVMNELKIENKRLLAELESATENGSADLKDEIARLSSLNEEKDAIIVSLNDEIERVNAENIALAESSKVADEARMGDISDTSSNAYKLDTYNKISSQLGDILINANRNADQIVSSARNKSKQIINDTEIECNKRRSEAFENAMFIRERVARISENITRAVSDDLNVSVDSCIKEINTCIDDMKYEIQTMMTRLTSRSNEISEKLSYYRTNASDAVNQKMSELDLEYSKLFSDGEDENV